MVLTEIRCDCGKRVGHVVPEPGDYPLALWRAASSLRRTMSRAVTLRPDAVTLEREGDGYAWTDVARGECRRCGVRSIDLPALTAAVAARRPTFMVGAPL